MVDFKNSGEVRRWLTGKPHDWSVVIAARAVLRMAPLLSIVLERGDARIAERDIILPTFRGMAAPWVAAAWPTYGVEIVATRAVSATIDAAHAVRTSKNVDREDRAVRATIDAAHAAARVIDTTANWDDVVLRAAHVVSYAVHAVVNGTKNANEAQIWAAVSADATALNANQPMGLRPSDLAIQELWPVGPPTWVAEHWSILRSALLAANEDWDVWTDWYEARLYGVSAGFLPRASLEVARVMIEEEVWEQGPKVVNAHIKRLMEEHEKREEREIFQGLIATENIIRTDDDNLAPNIPAPRRAAVEPVWDKGRLTLPKSLPS